MRVVNVLFDGTTEDMKESVTQTEAVEIAGVHIGEDVKQLLTSMPDVLGVHDENSNFRLYCKDAYEILPRIVETLKCSGQRPAVGIEHLTLEEAFKVMVGGGEA